MGIFKAYDIRGVVPDELNEEIAERIGVAMATLLHVDSLVVGRDMRTHGESISHALIQGILSTGTDVVDIGMVTTPMSYFAIGYLGKGGGVMVTASHNPARYNGFKLSREDAIPLSYETGIGELERLVAGLAGSGKRAGPVRGKAKQKGKVIPRDIAEAYIGHVLKFAEELRPLKVVVDAGNGMAGKYVQSLFERLPVEIVPLYFDLDGTFPNHEANPLKEENTRDLVAGVRETGADLGVAFDGDADRCIFCDERGAIVSSDLITALIAREVLTREPGAGILYDLRSSLVVPEEIKKYGGVPAEERVGHAYMKATMRARKCAFGGELSGHFYFRDNYYADSAMIALIKVLNVVSAEGKPFGNILAPLKRYFATGEINFHIEDKDGAIARIGERFSDGQVSHLDGITVKYDDWWFNVRKSNTEPLLRLNLEAKTRERMEAGLARVTDLLS